jgi:hypothetical protein
MYGSFFSSAPYRRLRIATSAMCLIACALLSALWVRSYFSQDFVKGSAPGIPAFAILSDSGMVFMQVFGWDQKNPWYVSRWQLFQSKPRGPIMKGLPFIFSIDPSGPRILMPYRFLVAIAAALAAIPWIRWSKQFTLRTMLITTTLVAFLLWLLVAAGR